jgi:fructose-specific component phosphotransferase system IIB-like protein
VTILGGAAEQARVVIRGEAGSATIFVLAGDGIGNDGAGSGEDEKGAGQGR